MVKLVKVNHVSRLVAVVLLAASFVILVLHDFYQCLEGFHEMSLNTVILAAYEKLAVMSMVVLHKLTVKLVVQDFRSKTYPKIGVSHSIF